jgi:hypothetical protein
MDIELGQAWEMYSAKERRWVRVVVAKVDDDRVTLRPQGIIEFFTVELLDIQNKPDLFRQPKVRLAARPGGPGSFLDRARLRLMQL